MSPAETSRAAAARPPHGHGPWSPSDYHLAAIVDQLKAVRQAVIAAAGGTPSAVEPYPRPGVASGAPVASDETRDFMARRRQKINAELRAAQDETPRGAE